MLPSGYYAFPQSPRNKYCSHCVLCVRLQSHRVEHHQGMRCISNLRGIPALWTPCGNVLSEKSGFIFQQHCQDKGKILSKRFMYRTLLFFSLLVSELPKSYFPSIKSCWIYDDRIGSFLQIRLSNRNVWYETEYWFWAVGKSLYLHCQVSHSAAY